MATGWDSSLATGVPMVDNEHKELFRQFENLHQAMLQGKGRQEIGKIVDFLANYVVVHFAHEEKIMDELRCPVAKANKAAHEQLIAKFNGLHNRFKSEGANGSLVLEIHDTLKNWLIGHIQKIDLNLASLAKTPGQSPAMV